jgi:hypothetical protein
MILLLAALAERRDRLLSSVSKVTILPYSGAFGCIVSFIIWSREALEYGILFYVCTLRSFVVWNRAERH